MNYSIGKFSELSKIPSSTLRYYDKEGLFTDIPRTNGGTRVFSDFDLGTVKVIECLKSTGLSIKDIKEYMDLNSCGDSTLKQRQEIFLERLKIIEEQERELQKVMAMIKFKCWYYDKAVSLGSESPLKKIKHDEFPEEIEKLLKIIYE